MSYKYYNETRLIDQDNNIYCRGCGFKVYTKQKICHVCSSVLIKKIETERQRVISEAKF